MIDPDMTEEEAVAAGMPERAGLSHEQMNGRAAGPPGVRASPRHSLSTFAEWTRDAQRDSSQR
ncbi:hypothetical protein [Micromonospora sp. A202]|uniref:hypothetical protein n=1 Tax=Micromonospora sp. A202 TaxID=2572899 RepID=UPI001152F9F1|nr:hypothetical protein [Micromonospora sp. A202]